MDNETFSTNGKPDADKIRVLAEQQAAKLFTAMYPATPEQLAEKVTFITSEYERAAISEIENNRAREEREEREANTMPDVHIPRGMTIAKAQDNWTMWNDNWTHAWGGARENRLQQMAKCNEHRSYWAKVLKGLRIIESQQEAA